MEYGLGGLSPLWGLVQPQVAKFARACTYDRAGYGWSETSPYPRTSQQMVKELHTLLTNAGIDGPYILVGHSLGGLNMRLFANQYPQEVIGVVLVDALSTNAYTRLGAPFKDYMAATKKMFQTLAIISQLGLIRMGLQFKGSEAAPEFVRKLPPRVQPLVTSQFHSQTFKAALAEMEGIENSMREVKQTNFPEAIPLIVISHGMKMFSDSKSEETEYTWQQLQEEMVNLSKEGSLEIAAYSGHDIHLDQPELVIAAIEKIMENQASRKFLNKN
jgi:pimeloyl-ACP methyl ester carboxylesterase